MSAALSPYTVTIGTTQFSVIASPDAVDHDVPPGYQGGYSPQEADKQTVHRDVALYNLGDFRRGCGALRRTGERDDGKLAWFENGFGHLGALQPSGDLRASGAGLGLTVSGAAPTGMAVIGSVIFDGHLWCITSGGLVVRYPNADPTATPVCDPPLDTFGVAVPKISLHPGYVCTGIAVFRKPSNEPALYVSAYNDSVPASRIYEYALSTAGTHWTPSAVPFANYKIEKLTTVWWQGRDGVGASRLAGVVTTITGGAPSTTRLIGNQIRHVIGGQDPLVEANWVAPIVVGSGGYAINSLVGAGQHLIPICGNGIHDFDEQRSFNLTKYWETTASFNNGTTAAILGRYLYTNRGFGIDRIFLGDLGVEQNEPGECGPAYGSQDGIVANTGQITQLMNHSGALLWTLYNARNRTTYVGRGYPNTNQDEVNPLRHFYAEQVIPSSAGVGQQVTHLTVTSPQVTGGPTLPDRSLWQWLFTADQPSTGPYNFRLYCAPLPLGAGPLSITTSEVDYNTASPTLTFSHNPVAKFYFPAQTWDDLLATKYVRQFDTFGEQVTNTQTISLYTRTEADEPTGITNLLNWDLAGTAGVPPNGSNVARIKPSTEVSGSEIGLLAVLNTPGPSGSRFWAPHLKAISPRAKVVREVYDVKQLWVVLEHDHRLSGGQIDVVSPDTAWSTLVGYANAGRQSYVGEDGVPSQVMIEQDLTYTRARVRVNNRVLWRTIARVVLSKV